MIERLPAKGHGAGRRAGRWPAHVIWMPSVTEVLDSIGFRAKLTTVGLRGRALQSDLRPGPQLATVPAINDSEALNPLTVYITRPAAPVCERVLEFLDRRGYSYTTVDVATDADREELKRRTGQLSCPVVVAGDEVIGKLPQTIDADRSGRLAELLRAPRS